ncbi:unnamed protein product [Euphydryas editha]|uniref:Serpin domain-containing protein n=1 Tax=Euphydryas editha TaxID=104508 RepID=A0AAU9TUN8_EUPED|nr:unnamed protein product [Euphydryas editha]
MAQFENTFRNYKRTSLGDSIDIASMKLLKEIYEESSNKNVVTSPLGVLILLSLYGSGSEGKIREEIMQLLGYNDYKQLSDFYTQLSQKFSAMDPSYLTLANKVLVSDKFSVTDEFSRTAREYDSEVSSIDFSEPKGAADVRNDWSPKKTKAMLNNPVSESDIDPATAIALLNVIFFQGHWHVPFNANETKEKEFNVDTSTVVKLPMMHLNQSLFYWEDKDMGVQMIELPYKETKFRMIVVLPNDIDGLPEVLKKASEKGLLENVFRMHPVGAELLLDIPKFEIRSKINLNSILQKVGVSSIFKNASTGIVNESSVVASEALQEVFVKVDEEVTTAGANTGLFAVPTSSLSQPPKPISFKVDRPFLYAILHDDIIVFAGTYAH